MLLRSRILLESYTPWLQCLRSRSKINIQKPKPPHHEKAVFIKVTQPYLINPNKERMSVCQKNLKLWQKNEDNPFQKILAQELHRWFKTSRLIVFYHMNPMNADDQFKAFAQLKKQNMHFKSYGKKTLELAVVGTPYEAVLELYISRNLIVFSPEPAIKQLLKVTKKFPQIILLAGIFEGKFISKDELLELSAIPDLETAQAGLVQALNNVGSHLVGQLTSHQNVLVSQLEERSKQLSNL